MNSNQSKYLHPRLAKFIFAATLVLTSWAVPRWTRAVTLTPGDIIIGANIGASTTSVDWGLLEIDPATGNRTIIADNTTGSGPAMQPTTTISFAPDGSLLVAYDDTEQSNSGVLYRVDPATGNRTIVSSSASNTGPGATYLEAAQIGSTIFMAGGPIVSVNPTTGDRTLFSGTGQGTGPDMNANGFAVSGTNLVVTTNEGAILNVDTTTGNRTVVSSPTVGTGAALNIPVFIATGVAGNLIVDSAPVPVQFSPPAILSIDPITGNRTVISGETTGTGPTLGITPTQVGVAADGTIYVTTITNFTLAQTPVLAIDPATGNRTIVADGTHGTGPLFDPSYALAVVPTPEPSTLVLAALGGLALLIFRRRRR